MIYAIILIIIGLVAFLSNKKTISKKAALYLVCTAPLVIIWGITGIVILNTIRYSVAYENMIYWQFLILGSTIEILIGILFIINYLKVRKNIPRSKIVFLYQNILSVIAILVGIATMIVS